MTFAPINKTQIHEVPFEIDCISAAKKRVLEGLAVAAMRSNAGASSPLTRSVLRIPMVLDNGWVFIGKAFDVGSL
jgi:hypothetical protein